MTQAGKIASKSVVEKLKSNSRVWLVFLILLPLLINTFRSPNNDFETIAVIVREWFTGKTILYSTGSAYFNYTPWFLFIYLPLSFIPFPFGQLIFNIISICLLIWSTWYLSKPLSWWMLAISLTTLYTSMLIVQGQCDAIVLAALVLGWIGVQRKNPWLIGVALVGMTIKYTNILVPLALLLFSIRKWPLKQLLIAAVIPLVTLGISFLLVGFDWPIRYAQLLKVTFSYFKTYEVITVFSKVVYPISYRLIQPPFGYLLIALLAIPALYLLFRILRKGINLNSLFLAIGLNLVISPYFTFHHLINLAPLQAQLLQRYRIWGVILYGAALVDIVMMWLGVGLIVYPAVALLILMIINFKLLKYGGADFGDELPLAGEVERV